MVSRIIHQSAAVSLLCCTAPMGHAQTSANPPYQIETSILDGGGAAGSSLNGTYSSQGSFTAIAGQRQNLDYEVKEGFWGQIYEPESLQLDIAEADLTEGLDFSIIPFLKLDDDSLLPLAPQDVTWSHDAAVSAILPDGTGTAAAVYEDTATTISGSADGLTGTVDRIVLNTLPDNFGSYSGDGLEDGWQVNHFGLDNPLAAPAEDPDGDGQDNHFEFIADLVPTDPDSRFVLTIQPAATLDGMELTFSPIKAGRSYEVVRNLQLSQTGWDPLPGPVEIENGAGVRTVTDRSATAPASFYKVEITRE